MAPTLGRRRRRRRRALAVARRLVGESSKSGDALAQPGWLDRPEPGSTELARRCRGCYGRARHHQRLIEELQPIMVSMRSELQSDLSDRDKAVIIDAPGEAAVVGARVAHAQLVANAASRAATCRRPLEHCARRSAGHTTGSPSTPSWVRPRRPARPNAAGTAA